MSQKFAGEGDPGRRAGYLSVFHDGFCAPLLASVQFLTVSPPLVHRSFTPAELGRAVGYFPLVGLIIGSLLALADAGLVHVFAPGVATALTLSAWVILTGALHLDGFMDTCDGLLGGATPEDRLRILRDVHAGAFAVAGGVLLLLVKYSALAAVPHRGVALLLAPLLGRWAIAVAVVTFPYARAEGLGRAMKDHAGSTQMVIATAVALAGAWTVGRTAGVVAVGVAGIVIVTMCRFALSRLPGLTGDIYGAICEVVETAVLLALAAGRV